MKLSTVLIWAAAGAAVAYYFSTENGKKVLNDLTTNYKDVLGNVTDTIKNAVTKVSEGGNGANMANQGQTEPAATI